jgi:hypothetical protein
MSLDVAHLPKEQRKLESLTGTHHQAKNKLRLSNPGHRNKGMP